MEPFEIEDSDDFRRVAHLFGCEHSTLLTIMMSTLSQLRDFPIESCHPSMAAMLMAINALKASYTAAYIHGNKDIGDFLFKMYQEITEVINKTHIEASELFRTNGESSSEIPDAFKKAFEKDGF